MLHAIKCCLSFTYIHTTVMLTKQVISTVHSAHYYTDVPLPPIIENVTVGTTWINLTWDHNESCCRNGKYELSWQQWQSKEASDDMNSSNILNPDRHPSITPLKPGTMYIVTLSVECQMYELQNATISVNTSIGKFMYNYIYAINIHAVQTVHVQDSILCCC